MQNDDLDFSICDPFASKAEADEENHLGPTGPGCNKLCNGASSSCVGTQSNDRDFFIMVFEAVSGPNIYYGDVDDADKYDEGPGDLFSEANMKEMKRLEGALLANPESCDAFDDDDTAACNAKDISGDLEASIESCLGIDVEMDGSFDLSSFNDDSDTCKYNPGYKSFCLIRDRGLGVPGECDTIYGLMNFFYPRQPPPVADQLAQLLQGALRPESRRLLCAQHRMQN